MSKKTSSKLPKEAFKTLGRLTSMGLTEAWHVALLLPSEWRDYRNPQRVVTEMDAPIILDGVICRNAETGFHNGVPRLHAVIADERGFQLRFYLYGDHRETAAQMKRGARVVLRGVPTKFHGFNFLHQAEIVPPEWIGRLCPRYPGKAKVINPETVRERVLELGDKGGAWKAAVSHIRDMLAKHGDPDKALAMLGILDLYETIRDAHLPNTVENGTAAQAAIEQLAALLEIAVARSGLDRSIPNQIFQFNHARVQERIKALPYALTDEQLTAIQEILADLEKPMPMRRILSGDVGTGKTFVYSTVAAAVADHAGRVAILAPTLPLANQVANEIRKPWPDIKLAVVAGDEASGIEDASILVGTTALLHRKVGPLDMVIVDEQQKFGRDQREQLAGGGVHLLEASGTCIPRSMALIRYGAWAVSKLTKTHTHKVIHNRLWKPHERAELMNFTRKLIEQDVRTLVVYPLKSSDTVRSAETAFLTWDRLFPGKVRLAHAGLSDDEKQAAIDDMKTGKATILVATTVAEVGLDIPNLRHVLVVEPDRLGLTQLHQIRGRAARNGGEGWFSMFLREEAKDKTVERLSVMLETTNGFEIARRDLEIRGHGSLRADAERQSGHGDAMFGRPISMAALDRAAEMIGQWLG